MANHPKTYETIVWEEKDIWKDVVDLLANYLPEHGFTIYDRLIEKYEIKLKQ